MTHPDEMTRTCPRCGSLVGYGACPSCALEFTCVNCQRQLENPLGLICGFCRTPIRQPDWSPAASEAAGDQGSVAATLPPLVAVASRFPGRSLREAACDFAAALLTAGNGKEAVRVLTLALGTDGDPPDRDVLLLRSRAHEVGGDLDEAMSDLVRSVAGGTSLDSDIAERLHVLLDCQDDAGARKRLLRNLVADSDPWDEACSNRVDLLRLHAAVIQADEPAADDALGRLLSTSRGRADAQALLTTLGNSASLPPKSHFALAKLMRVCGANAPALALLERVLAATSQDDSSTAERSTAQLLRAQLLDDLGRPAEAGRAYFEAGRDLYWADQFDEAAEPLREAVAHPTDDPEVVWTLADNTRLQALNKQPPDVGMLWQAAELCATGHRQAAGKDIPSWALRLRAYLADDISDYDAARCRRDMFEGLAALEDCVGMSSNWRDLALLAQFHRALAHPATCLATLDSITDLPDPEDADGALDQIALLRAAALLEIRSPDAADQVDRAASRPLGALPGGWLLAQADRWSDALPLLEQAVEEEPESLVGWLSLGVAALRSGYRDRATESFQRVVALDDAKVAARFNSPLIPIEAHYRTGDYVAAATLCEQAITGRKQSMESVAAVYAFLSLSRLAAGCGDVDEAARLALSKARLADEMMGFSTNLTELEQLLVKDKRHHDARVARHWASRAKARSDELRDALGAPDAAIAEITAAIDDADDSVEATACRMALTRLMPASVQATEVSSTSLQILAERPDSPAGARRLVDATNLIADRALVGGSAQQARDIIRSAQASVPTYRHALRATLTCRAALASAFLDDPPAAESEIAEARHEFGRADLNGEDEVIRTWRSTLAAPEHYWRLRRSTGWCGEISRVGDACLSAMLRLNELNDPATMWPSTAPIILQIAESLVPEDTTPQGPMLGAHIPALRRRLVEQVTAIQLEEGAQTWLPGIHVRADDTFEDGEFQIQIFEIPCFRGVVPADSTFCLASPGKAMEVVGPEEADLVISALNPAAGTPGAWVTNRLADRLEAAGLPLWSDPLVFVLAELEHQLRLHASEFFTVDEVAYLLRLHAADDGEASAVREGDASAAGIDLALLTSTIRLLLRSGNALRSWPALLAAVRSSRLPTDAAAAYRRTVPDETISKMAWTIRIPARLAELATRQAGGVRPRAAEILAAIGELREVLSAVQRPVSLATTDPALRDIVQSYVSREFPDMVVVVHQDPDPKRTSGDG